MPPLTALSAFKIALATGRTSITQKLDAFFSNPAQVKAHARWPDLQASWPTTGLPAWLSGVLDADVGLSVPERTHVLAWPISELEKARVAAVNSVTGVGVVAPTAPKFFWELYPGPTPHTDVRFSPAGETQIVFQSPRAAVDFRGDEVFVGEVPENLS